MNRLSDIPFENRVFVVPQICPPGLVELCGYTSAAQMTPALVESIVVETEAAIGEPVRHTARKLFPKPLEIPLQDEVALAWKAPKRVLQLSNKLSRPNYVSITASRFPKPSGGAYPADWAYFSIRIKQDAPAALEILTRVGRYASLSGAFFVRADSPMWWESRDEKIRKHSDLAFVALRMTADAGWSIGERLGWINYFGQRAAQELGLAECEGRSRELWLTEEPFNFSVESHAQMYASLLKQLEPHRVPIRGI